MDIISIHELKAQTIIGTHPWEQAIKQAIWLDIDMGIDARAAAQLDELTATIDYEAISHQIVEFVGASTCKLIETLAERIAELLLDSSPMSWLKLTLTKRGSLEHAKAVSVTIERQQQNNNNTDNTKG